MEANWQETYSIRADAALGDRIPDRQDLAVVMPGIADDQLHPAALRQGSQSAGVRRLDRHRFLQQQMQPPVEDRAGQIGMGRMRHGDDGRIQLGLRQHLGRAGEDTLRRNLEALGRAIAILRIGIGDAGDDGIRIGLQGRQMGPGRPPAAADDPDLRAHASSTRCRRNSS